MDNTYKQTLLKEIADEHHISAKALNDLIKAASQFNYENVTTGKRQDEYLGIITFAIHESHKKGVKSHDL